MYACKTKITNLTDNITDANKSNQILMNVCMCEQCVCVCVCVCVNPCHVCLGQQPQRTKVSFDTERKASGGSED